MLCRSIIVCLSYVSNFNKCYETPCCTGGGPGAVVKVACLESRRSRGRTPLWHSSFKETTCFFPAHSQRFNIVGSLRDREVVSSASHRHSSDFWQGHLISSHHPQAVLLAHFSLYVHKGCLKPHSFIHFNKQWGTKMYKILARGLESDFGAILSLQGLIHSRSLRLLSQLWFNVKAITETLTQN